ncbi:hypothetical protein Y032_0556g3383 [Ancylostoma ceylanicum]|uniref:Saposin B-type domain-containing protein n=1 Tax=Ancylostoma ceylanicum TaxID=53326 RepID=A0A016WPP6_9BILA|nr:hypothetical protein Y032_0556g3383 [Ancylostoma ceylanicum]
MYLFPLVFIALSLFPLIYSNDDEYEDLSAVPTSTLTPQETCELCQVALRTVYGHFGANVPSKRKLVHQLKHECKRHFNYRRRCLLLMKVNYDMIFREMTDGSFRPMEVCLIMKECKPLDSPLSPEIIDPGQPEAFALVSKSDDNYDSSDD